MMTIVDALPDNQVKELATASPALPGAQITAAEGDALRALRVIIFEHDPVRRFGGSGASRPRQETSCGYARDHAEYDPGLRRFP